MTIIAKTKTPKINQVDSAPCRPNSRVFTRADGSSATIPANIMSEIPLPIPRAVTCSPIHIKNTTPPTSVITADILKYNPGSMTILPAPSRPMEIPQACSAARNTVPYLVY